MAENNQTAKKGGLGKFFRETKAELKKVSWPSKKQLIRNTLIILAFIIIVSVILSVLDMGFGALFDFVLGRLS